MNVVVTDIKYRMTVSAVRELIKEGHSITLVHRDDGSVPLCFYIKGNMRKVTLPKDEKSYIEGLCKLLRGFDEPPVLLPCGAFTTEIVSKNKQTFSKLCFFLAPDPIALELCNDKFKIRQLAAGCGIDVPEEYAIKSGETATDLSQRVSYPCVVKFVCGEKYGLSAKDRYSIVADKDEFVKTYEKMAKTGPLIVQQYIEGEGIGVGIAMHQGRPVSYICHRRRREYPVSGGPSTMAESFYDKELVEKAAKLLLAADFEGPAMVEFKRDRQGRCVFLEVNPRIWGSFPLARIAGEPFTQRLCEAAAGKAIYADVAKPAYKLGVQMRFAISDMMTIAGYFKKGDRIKAMDALRAVFTKIPDGLFERGGAVVSAAYIRSLFKG